MPEIHVEDRFQFRATEARFQVRLCTTDSQTDLALSDAIAILRSTGMTDGERSKAADETEATEHPTGPADRRQDAKTPDRSGWAMKLPSVEGLVRPSLAPSLLKMLRRELPGQLSPTDPLEWLVAGAFMCRRPPPFPQREATEIDRLRPLRQPSAIASYR